MFSSQSSQVTSSGPANYIEDVFSTYVYTGNGLSQFIENGISLGASNTGGSAYFDGSGDVLKADSNIAFQLNADFTVEGWAYPLPPVKSYQAIFTIGTEYGIGDNIILYFNHAGNPNKYLLYVNSNLTLTGTIAPGNYAWNHFALTRSGNTWRLFVNGALDVSTTLSGTVFSVSPPAVIASESLTRNITDFTGYISNFRIVKGTAVYTSSFTPPTTQLTAISGTSLLVCQGDTPFIDKSSNAFAITVNGNTSAKTLGPFTSATAGKGGLVWTKSRSNPYWNEQTDTVRGPSVYLSSNSTDAQNSSQPNHVTAFNANGFSVGNESDVNANGATFASWTFRKQPKFFDVVTYTGDGVTGRAVPHNLGSTPGCIIIKRLDSAQDFGVYHISGGQKLLQLNTANAWWSGGANYWYSTPTSTVFYPDNIAVADHYQNVNGASYVAYLFAHNAGGFGLNGTDNVISCGSYTGTGGAVEVNVGFEPQWIMFKSATAADNWRINDVMRGIPTGGADANLAADLSNAEYGTDNRVDVTSTGFIANASNSQSGVTHIYIAIRRGPMKVPTSGTSVFSPVASSANTGTITSGFPTDMVLSLDRTTGTSGYNRMAQDRLRGAFRILNTTTTDAEYVNATSASFASNSGIVLNGGSVYANGFVHEQFRRAPGFFDVVCYTGDGTASRAINHNLGVAPELIIKKSRSAATGPDWNTQAVGPLGYSSNLTINSSNSNTPNGITYLFATGNATTITTATNPLYINESGQTYVTYLFATCPGVSKVGSYTGTGTTKQIDCGFTGGARFVLIKRTDSTGDWYVWDTARGMVAGTDPNLQLNSASSQTNTNDVYTTTGGFQIVGTGAGINASGGTYIYLAIA